MLSIIAWPVVALLLGLVAIFVFRAPLSRFLDRAQEIGKTGIRASSSKQISDTAHNGPKADELLKSFDNVLLRNRETLILNHLSNSKIEEAAERERVLVRFLAGVGIALYFERTYAAIWGSQIAALQFLNEAGEGGIDPELLRPWYDQAAAQNLELYANYQFDRWLGFLETSLLVTKAQGRVIITLEGREFLKFIVHQGYTRFKQG